jgi:type IV secretion system protein TrbL
MEHDFVATHILTEITQQFAHATTGWHAYLFPIANHLFATLAVIELAWSGIWWALEKQDTHSITIEFLKKFVTIGLFYAVLLNSSTWIPAIIESFMKIGQGASQQYNLYPSDVMDQGISLAGNIFHSFKNTGMWYYGIVTLVGAFTGLVTLFSFSIIAGLLVVTLVESYIVLGAGVLMLGFASNRVSSKFATNYLSYAMGVGAKLFMLYLVLGIGGNLANDWIAKFQSMSTLDISPFLEISGGSLVYLFVAWAIPNKTESLMSGSSNATLGGFIAATTAVSGAASVMGAAVGTPMRAAMGGAASAVQTVQQASAIGQALGGGVGGYAAGAAAAGVNLATSTAGSLAGHYSKASSAMKQKTESVKDFFANRDERQAAKQPFHPRPTNVRPPKSS